MFDLIPWRRRGGNVPVTARDCRREFDDLVERFFGPERFDWLTTHTFSPAVDISESEHDIVVKAELPGIEQNDLGVSVTGDVLTIKGEKKEEKEKRARISTEWSDLTVAFPVPSGRLANSRPKTLKPNLRTAFFP